MNKVSKASSRKNSAAVSLLAAILFVFGIFISLPVSASGQGMPTIGLSLSARLDAPGNPHWDGANGTAVWDGVANAGLPFEGEYTQYYEWALYRLESDRLVTSPDDLNDYEQVRYGGIFEEDTYRCNLVEWLNEPGYYYFTVYACGDGINYTDSPAVVSDVFHYTKPQAKLPAPTGLKWQYYEAEDKYFCVWDGIFGDAFINAEGFNVKCFDEAGEVYTHFFTREELYQDRDTRGRPGAMLYMDEPDGTYRFKVQAVSSNLNVQQSSEWSDFSPWQEVHKQAAQPPVVNPPVNPAPGTSGGSSSKGSGSSDSGGSFDSTASAPATSVQTSSMLRALASEAKAKGESIASSRGTGVVTVKGSAWPQLAGLVFQHDTIANGAVQVRVTIHNPAALTQDIKVSGTVTGQAVNRIVNLFEKHFRNQTRAMHLDQTGEWGQEVRIAAKFPLAGMDKENLVFYSYDNLTNEYRQIQNPRYSIDANGYTCFYTPYAGDILVSDGVLVKK